MTTKTTLTPLRSTCARFARIKRRRQDISPRPAAALLPGELALLIESLRQSQRELDALFNQTLEGVFFMTLDAPVRWDNHVDKDAVLEYIFKHLRMTRVNDAMLAQYHAGREQFIGLTAEDFFLHDPEHGKDVFRQLYDAGHLHIETDERRFDGTQMWIEGDYICIYDELGHITGHFGVQRDVSERKRGEQALRDAQSRYRALFDQSNDAVFILDLNGRHLEANRQAAAMLGYSVEEIQHLSYRDLSAEVEQSNAVREAMLAGRHVPPYERIFRKKDGTLVPVEVNVEIVRDSSGSPLHIQSIVRDIRQRKQAQQQEIALALEQARMRMLAGFVQDAGHEFRTPLSIINSSVYLMSLSEDPERRESYALRVDQQVMRIKKLVDMLILLVKVDSGEPMHTVRVDINMLAVALYKEISQPSTHYIPRLHLELTEELPPVEVSEPYLREALLALLDNAQRYTDPEGIVILRTLPHELGVAVQIADTGSGIPEEHLEHIFELFWRHDDVHSTPGFGLGLPLARRIVERHGGSIAVQSTVGSGTVFTIVLPAATDAHASSER